MSTYIQRDRRLAEGARLLRRVMVEATTGTQAAYADWVKREQPTQKERAAILYRAKVRRAD